MKSQELLSQIKNLLGMEDVQLEKLSLDNGTVLEAELFESGKEVFILSDDEKIPLPVGEYALEDGRVLSVQEEGLISELYEHKDDEEKKEKKDEDEDKEKMRYVTREEFRKEMDDLKKHIEDEVKKMMDHKDKEKDEMASQVATEIALEMSNQPAAKPIKHSPENKKTEPKFKFAQNRKASTLDRVMESIINKK